MDLKPIYPIIFPKTTVVYVDKKSCFTHERWVIYSAFVHLLNYTTLLYIIIGIIQYYIVYIINIYITLYIDDLIMHQKQLCSGDRKVNREGPYP